MADALSSLHGGSWNRRNFRPNHRDALAVDFWISASRHLTMRSATWIGSGIPPAVWARALWFLVNDALRDEVLPARVGHACLVASVVVR